MDGTASRTGNAKQVGALSGGGQTRHRCRSGKGLRWRPTVGNFMRSTVQMQLDCNRTQYTRRASRPEWAPPWRIWIPKTGRISSLTRSASERHLRVRGHHWLAPRVREENANVAPTRSASFEVAHLSVSIEFESMKTDVKMRFRMSLSLRESRALTAC